MLISERQLREWNQSIFMNPTWKCAWGPLYAKILGGMELEAFHTLYFGLWKTESRSAAAATMSKQTNQNWLSLIAPLQSTWRASQTPKRRRWRHEWRWQQNLFARIWQPGGKVNEHKFLYDLLSVIITVLHLIADYYRSHTPCSAMSHHSSCHSPTCWAMST